MDTNEPSTDQKKFPWVITLIVILALLAGLHWWSSPSPDIPDTTRTDPYSTSTPIGTTSISETTSPSATTTNTTKPPTNFMHTITIETTKGTIIFETYDADAPKTAANFVSLAQKGFYDGIIFHRVIEGFMIQGGDPTGTGTGGPGYKFADELDPNTPSAKAGYVRGTVAMANSGPNTNGSQFFIMHQDGGLPHSYTIFGKVVKGMEVVDAIAATPTNGNPPMGSNRPLTEIKMIKVSVAAK